MTTLRKDLLNGTSLNRSPNGYSAIEVIDVLDTVGTTVMERMFNAEQFPGVPAAGEEHPFLPNTIVIDKRVEPLGANAENVRIFVFWGQPEEGTRDPGTDPELATVFSGITLRDFPVLFDSSGNQLKTTRTIGGITEVQTQIGTVTYPVLVIGATRREISDPANKAAQYVNKLNSSTIWGESAGRYLCTRLEGVSTNGGVTYDVTYEFQLSPLLKYGPGFQQEYSAWDNITVHTVNDRPIENPVFGETLGIERVFESEKFFALNLNLR